MAAMQAWLSALVQRFRTDPDPVPVPVLDLVPVEQVRKRRRKPKREGPRGFQAKMYGSRPKSAAELAWDEEPAARILPRGPSISELLAKDAEVFDPYQQEAFHTAYLTIRPRSGSEWDFCSACYFEDSRKIRQHKEALDKHFQNDHREGGAWDRCCVCTAMFFTQHLERHTKYCHPHIAVGI